MLWIPDNWRDIQRYYQGTWVKFKEYGDELFFINRVDHKQVLGTDIDQKDFVLHLSDEYPYEMSYVLPHKSLFVHGEDKLMQLVRVPARQYRRGICEDNVRVVDMASCKPTTLHRDYLRSYTEKRPSVSLKEALYGKGKARALRLTDRIWFRKPDQTLLVDSKHIAKFDRANSVIVGSSLFFPEIQALVAKEPFEVRYESV